MFWKLLTLRYLTNQFIDFHICFILLFSMQRKLVLVWDLKSAPPRPPSRAGCSRSVTLHHPAPQVVVIMKCEWECFKTYQLTHKRTRNDWKLSYLAFISDHDARPFRSLDILAERWSLALPTALGNNSSLCVTLAHTTEEVSPQSLHPRHLPIIPSSFLHILHRLHNSPVPLFCLPP